MESQKVSFGDTMFSVFKDPEKRKAFADRHNCSTKKDRTKAYWSCNLPRYAKQLEWVTPNPIGNETW